MARKPTIAMLRAELETRNAYIDTLEEDLRKLQRNYSQLQAKYEAQNKVGPRSIREEMARCKALAAQGVPCRVRNGRVVHALTGALL